MVNQEELKKWSKETVDYYLEEVKKVGENNATSFYNQSDLSRVKDCELMIIGINPGVGCLFSDWELKNSIYPEFLYKGNPCFEKKSDKEIIDNMSKEYDSVKRKYGWDLWRKIHKMLSASGKGYLLECLDRFVLSNMVFFGTNHENEIPKGINILGCATQTMKLISILQPKVVLLLGKKSRNLFDCISNNKLEVLVPKSIYHCLFEKSHVIAIKHTAYHYSTIEMVVIGKTIGYIIDHPDEIISRDSIGLSSLKNDIIDFEEKQKIMQLRKKVSDASQIVKMVTTCKDFQLKIIGNNSDKYRFSENLVLAITQKEKGYLAIRHTNFEGKYHYPNSKYLYTERYRSILNEKGWNCDSPVWLGQKFFKDFGNNENEIVSNIISEINDIAKII